MSTETNRRAPSRSGLTVAVAAAAAAAIVLAVQVLHLRELMDVNEPLTAGFAKALVGGYVLAVVGIGAFAAFAPRRLLWLPVGMAGLLFAVVLLATLTVGTEAGSFAMALVTMAACWRVGNWVLLRLGVPALAGVVPAAWLAGSAVLGLAILGIGRAGGLRWWTVAVPVIALGLSAIPPAARALGRLRARPPELSRVGAAAVSVIALLLGVACVFTAAPELMYDALYAKAWMPSEWARTGSIEPMTAHPVLNNLGFAQLLAVPGHLVDAGGVGRYMQLLSVAAVPAAVWWIARRSAWAPVAAVTVAITPHLFWQAATAYDDALLDLAGVSLAAAVARLMEDPREPAGGGLRTALAVGLLLGACLDLKLHLAGLGAGLVGGWLLFGVAAGRLRAAAGVAAGGFVVAAPPFAQRWIDVDNPLLPAFNNVFKSDLLPHRHETLNLPFFHDRDPIEVVTRSVTDPGVLNEASVVGSFGVAAIAVFAGVLVLWLRGRADRTTLVFWCALVLATLTWYQQFRYLRYLMPAGAVAITAFALAARGGRIGAPGERATAAVVCVAAALLWPSVVAQFWNVPGKDVPWEVAFHVDDDYDYERASTIERDIVSEFDRVAPAGAVASSRMHQRLWLTEGRSLSPNWETRMKLESPSAAPASEPLVDRLRSIDTEWLIWEPGGERLGLAGEDQLVQRHGEVAFSDQGWMIVHLVDRPRAPEPVPPCDDRLEGRPGCWNGTLDRTPGLTRAESPGGISRHIPICAGRTLVTTVSSRGRGDGIDVTVTYDDPDPLRGHTHIVLPTEQRVNIHSTAPPGTSTGATVTVLGSDGPTVDRIEFGMLGTCR